MSYPEYPTSNAQPPRPAPRSNLPVLILVLSGLLLVLAVPYVAERITYSITRGEERAKYDAAREELEGMPPVTSPYRLTAKIIEPSVVGITTTRVVTVAQPFFRQQQYEVPAGQGSGVIIDEKGYIVTNSHVVSDATAVDVKLSDGRIIKNAEVVGADPVSDLAVVRIEAANLIAAQWGDSDELEVGDEVLAMGNPYGLDRSATMGIISAKSRQVDPENTERSFLQTDAAVNPGNSGGPLVNLRGEIIGINTAIVGHSYRGISFAIPSQLAKPVYERLKTVGVSRGYLGVGLQNLTAELAAELGVKDASGALVAGVEDGSPAAQAGIQPGDVIVAIGDQAIANYDDLRLAVAHAEIGQEVRIVLYRNARKMELTVSIAERPMRPRKK